MGVDQRCKVSHDLNLKAIFLKNMQDIEDAKQEHPLLELCDPALKRVCHVSYCIKVTIEVKLEGCRSGNISSLA